MYFENNQAKGWGCGCEVWGVYWGGIHYRACTFITGGVASTSAASTTGGCTFIAGGVHTRTHVYRGWHPLQGGVPSLLGVCIPGHMCTGGGIHYRGCTFITGGVVQGMCPHKFYLGTCTCTCIKVLKQYAA